MTAAGAAGGDQDTARVRDRRAVRLESLDDLLRDAEACVAAERAGKLERKGNWTLGQIMGHLAHWMSMPYEGFPPMRRPPWPISKMMPLFKSRFLRKGLPPGFRIPGAPGGTYGTEVLTTDEGFERLRRAVERLRREEPRFPSPVLGPLSHDETIALHLRHAELHLSFLDPSGQRT